jgi:hypothetical protein
MSRQYKKEKTNMDGDGCIMLAIIAVLAITTVVFAYLWYKEKNSNRSMISLGPIEMIDLAQARAQAVEWRMRIRNGESPSVIRNGERRERRKAEIEV